MGSGPFRNYLWQELRKGPDPVSNFALVSFVDPRIGKAVRMRNFENIYIDGAWVPSDGTGSIEVTNAATEQVMGSVPDGVASDVASPFDIAVLG